MHALKPQGVRIPRVFRNHKGSDGRLYCHYVLSVLARLGSLPPFAEPTLKEAGRIVVQLEHLAQELEAAEARKRRRDISRCRKHQFMLREQLSRLETKLEAIAPPKGPRAHLDAVRTAVAEANRR